MAQAAQVNAPAAQVVIHRRAQQSLLPRQPQAGRPLAGAGVFVAPLGLGAGAGSLGFGGGLVALAAQLGALGVKAQKARASRIAPAASVWQDSRIRSSTSPRSPVA